MADKQKQKGSNNNQAGRDLITVNYSSDTQAIIALIQEAKEALRAEFNLANAKVSGQLEKLSEIMIPVLTQQKYKKAFEDPDFLHNINEAQKSAIRTDSEDDLKLLSNILEQRAQINDPLPRHKMATRKALEVVGQLSQSDLNLLTLLWYGIYMSPQLIMHEGGAKTMVNVFGDQLKPFVNGALPADTNWLNDLDILDCVNVGTASLNHLKSFSQLFSERTLAGYHAGGMNEEEQKEAASTLREIKPGLENLMIVHPFNDDAKILAAESGEKFKNIVQNNVKLNKDTEAKVERVITLNQYKTKLNTPQFSQTEELLKQNKTMKKVSDWWQSDTFPPLRITPVGVVLAYSNFKNLQPSINVPRLEDLL